MAGKVGEIFKPGETCRQSGIYQVTHDSQHIAYHEVTVVNGEEFPPCNHCGKHPRFVLVRPAMHLSDHPSFKAKK